MAGSFTVSGKVTYDFVAAVYNAVTDKGTLDFANAAERPVRNGQVRVLEGTTVLATTNTAADGTYTLGFTSMGTAPLTVQAVARTASPAIVVQDNTARNAVWAIAAGVPMGGGTVNLHATHGWKGTAYAPAERTAAPFAVLDSMYTAAQAFVTARPALSFPTLKVNWSPNNTTDPNGALDQGFLGTSFFDPDSNQIYIVGKDAEDTDEFDNHVIVHEWGHFFEANASRSDSLGGNHSTGDVLDPRDSFAEGWGDAASGILTGNPLYVDTYWTRGALDAWGFDVETEPTMTDDPNPGAFSESSVMRFIYDAFDSTNEGAFDRLSLGLGPIADAYMSGVKGTDALTTIAALANALKAGGAPAADVDALLARYGMGSITSDFGDGDAPLRAMFATVASMPVNTTVMLDGRVDYNFKGQNKFWVIQGNGARITVTATSAQDVGIAAYRKGVIAGESDNLSTGGTESFSFNSMSGATYVVTVTGYGTGGTYGATIAITSP